MKQIYFIISILLFLSSGLARSQDVHFSQFYANKPKLNPAMVGLRSCPTVFVSYKNQWPSLSNAYKSYALHYSQYVEALHGGVGLSVVNDTQGGGNFNTFLLSGMYAFRAQLTREFKMHASLNISYMQQHTDYSQLIFPDMVNASGISQDSREAPHKGVENYIDFGGGVFIFSNDYYIGLAGFHLNKKNKILNRTSNNAFPRRYTFHFGGKFDISRRRENKLLLSPSFALEKQGNFNRINSGLYITWKSITFGGWFHQDFKFKPVSYTIMAGFVHDFFKISYSNDFMISDITKKILPSHEVSLSLYLNCLENKKEYEAISCPDF